MGGIERAHPKGVHDGSRSCVPPLPPARVSQAEWSAKAAQHRFIRIMYDRCDPDVWFGVRTHELNKLWCTDEDPPDAFTRWLKAADGTHICEGMTCSYGLFKMSKKITLASGEKYMDTLVCFAGPGETINPQYRDVAYKLATDVTRLSTDSPDHDRLLRLIQRRLAAKRPSSKPSPNKPPTPTAPRAEYDEAGAIAVTPDPAPSGRPGKSLSAQCLVRGCEHSCEGSKRGRLNGRRRSHRVACGECRRGGGATRALGRIAGPRRRST